MYDPFTAFSRSASAKITFGLFPPNSNVSRFKRISGFSHNDLGRPMLARERDLVDPLMLHQRSPRRWSEPWHHVNNTIRKPCLFG